MRILDEQIGCLSPRYCDVLRLARQGYTHPEISEIIEAFQIAWYTGADLNLGERLKDKELSAEAAAEVRECISRWVHLMGMAVTVACEHPNPSVLEWLKDKRVIVVVGITGSLAIVRKGFSQVANGLSTFLSKLAEKLHTIRSRFVGWQLKRAVYVVGVGLVTIVLIMNAVNPTSDNASAQEVSKTEGRYNKPPRKSLNMVKNVIPTVKSTGNLSTATPLAQGEEPPQTQAAEMSPNPGEERSRLSAEATPSPVIKGGLIQPQPIVPKRSDYIAPVPSVLQVETELSRPSISNLKESQESTKIPGLARANNGSATEVLTFKNLTDTSQPTTIGEMVGKVVQEQHFLWAYLQEDSVTGEFIGARLGWDSPIEISPKKCVTLRMTFSTGAIRSKALTQNLRS